MPLDVVEHARFFDHLVELVPAKYYYDEDFSRLNPRYLAKAAREALKADVKFKAKLAKREKLDPEKAATTLDIQRRKTKEAQQPAQANGAAVADAAANGPGPSTSGRKNNVPASGAESAGAAERAAAASGLHLQLSGGAFSRQELLERLHMKVEEARKARKASSEAAIKAKEWKQNALKGSAAAKQQQQQHQKQGKQDKQQQAGAKRKAGSDEGTTGGSGKQSKQQQQQQPQGQGHAAKKARRWEQAGGEEADADFKFARIEVEEGGRHGKAQQKRAPKQVLLKQAEAQKAELEALAGTEEGKSKAQQAAWKSALARASGEKVLDDPKLLRRSLKRENKLKDKRSKAWQERVAAQQESQAARQAKRKDNMAARRQTKLDNKKTKREKKLLRPGFEGRKEGFITPAAGGAK